MVNHFRHDCLFFYLLCFRSANDAAISSGERKENSSTRVNFEYTRYIPDGFYVVNIFSLINNYIVVINFGFSKSCYCGFIVYATYHKCDPLTNPNPLEKISNPNQLIVYFIIKNLK